MPENLGDILGQEHLTTIKALNDKVDKLQNELTMIKSDAIKLLKSITGASDESGVDLQSFVKKNSEIQKKYSNISKEKSESSEQIKKLTEKTRI